MPCALVCSVPCPSSPAISMQPLWHIMSLPDLIFPKMKHLHFLVAHEHSVLFPLAAVPRQVAILNCKYSGFSHASPPPHLWTCCLLMGCKNLRRAQAKALFRAILRQGVLQTVQLPASHSGLPGGRTWDDKRPASCCIDENTPGFSSEVLPRKYTWLFVGGTSVSPFGLGGMSL